MARKIGDIVAPLGQYVDSQTNEQKTRWGKCGVLIETDKGMRIKLDLIPVTTDANGMWLSVFSDDNKPSQNQQKPAQAAAQAPQQGGLDDDTPF